MTLLRCSYVIQIMFGYCWLVLEYRRFVGQSEGADCFAMIVVFLLWLTLRQGQISSSVLDVTAPSSLLLARPRSVLLMAMPIV